jgi:hypothetical protein
MFTGMTDDRSRVEHEPDKKGIALYHHVFAREGFDGAAKTIYRLTYDASQRFPGVPRFLFLDIDGHRNPAGGFDHEMFELLQEFLLGFLAKYVTEIQTPLYHVKASSGRVQEDPPSEDLRVFASEEQAEQVRAELESHGVDFEFYAPRPRDD